MMLSLWRSPIPRTYVATQYPPQEYRNLSTACWNYNTDNRVFNHVLVYDNIRAVTHPALISELHTNSVAVKNMRKDIQLLMKTQV